MDKVRDQEHVTGQYRGAVHGKENLVLRRPKVPVFFQNFKGYDSLFMTRITRGLKIFGEADIRLIMGISGYTRISP